MQQQSGKFTSHDQWIGLDAYDSEGDKVGEITDVFYDDKTGRPEWLAIKTGLFGTKDTFVPIHGSQILSDEGDDDGSLRLAFDKDMIKSAPQVDAEGNLSPDEERELWQYYGYEYDADPSQKTHGYGSAYQRNRADKDYASRRYNRETDQWVEAGDEESVTIHNQEARVVDQPETVRLRKYQRTEMVPVTKEEVRVERTTDNRVSR